MVGLGGFCGAGEVVCNFVFMQVSIIIPTYNSAAYLERAFASAIGQEGVDFEVIIVDNNSTDGTLALMEKLRTAHPEQVRLAQESTQGSAAARNHGVRLAKGDWIQFLDSDDVLLAGKLRRQVALGAEYDWVVGASIDRDITGREEVSTVNEDYWKGLVHNGGIGNTNANLIRKSKYLAVGGQDESLMNGVDTELWFRLLCDEIGVVRDEVPGAVYIDREGPRLSTLKSSVSRLRSVVLKGKVIKYLAANRPVYFAKNAGFFRGALLNAIRMLATENLDEAANALEEYFPEGVKSGDVNSGIVPGFVRLYGVFGFRVVEGSRMLLRNILPASLKRRIKRV